MCVHGKRLIANNCLNNKIQRKCEYLFEIQYVIQNSFNRTNPKLNSSCRTEYWKSNARVFCDFCKCWYADNKPVSEYLHKSFLECIIHFCQLQSKAFHEGGKKHKEAVAQRLHDINKRSVKEERAKDKFNAQLRQMEDAAMKAYADDLSRGGDISSQSFNVVMRGGDAGSSKPVDPMLPPVDLLEEREKVLNSKCVFIR